MTKSKITKIFYVLLLILIFLLSLFLRLKVFIVNQSFWHDECALAWNILNKSYLELLNPLRFLQVAPPLFLIFTKFITQIFGSSENIFRFIPFFASVLSIIAFYLLTVNLFTTKKAILFANLMFAMNFPLYYYASEFKPYSIDVLFCLITLLFFIKLKPKNLWLQSTILSTFIWISFPTAIFILSGAILFLIDKQYNLKQKLSFLSPLILSSILFYLFYFLNVYNSNHNGMINYWNSFFISPNNTFHLINEFIKFSISSNFLIPLLIIFGAFIFLKENNKSIKISLISVFLLLVLSALKFYPFFGRLILFIIPVFILLWIKPIDKKGILILVLFLITTLHQIDKTIEVLKKKEIYKNNPNPREMLIFIKSNANPNDIIYVNEASNADYLFYKQIIHIPNKYIIKNINELKYNDKVWLFFPNGFDAKTKKDIENNFLILYKNATPPAFLGFGIKK